MAIQFSEINDDAQAQVTVNGKAAAAESPVHGNTLLAAFIKNQTELESHKNGKPVIVDGHTLSIPNVVAVARYGAHATLDTSPSTRERVDASQNAIDKKLADGLSVYGLSTGYGGSADTRTNDHLILGKSLLQHQHSGILPSSNAVLQVLPLSDPMSNSSMPESWVRAAMLIRMNSLIRGHSGVRWKFIEALGDLLEKNVTPVVPLRGSISASGDLSPLSYVAGTLIGNPGIRVFSGPAVFGSRQVKPAPIGLEEAGLEPLRFFPKEHLGLLNGTAFSAAVATLALNDAVHIALLAQVTTAMGTEALIGTQGSYTPFIHDVARPHRGQIESARIIHTLLEDSKFASQGEEKEMTIEEDYGTLRQDRYALRTAPQFMGPQLEDILSALDAVTQECNSTTDNPLIDGTTGNVHHGGNFQAMAITNPMERTRLSLHHFGKLIFAQLTELLNPAFNRGLPPSLAASDPSVNYFAKGVDIASAAYVSELGYLANPVSTHIQSAEMHNQSVNSLALISARATITSLEVLTMLVSNYLYVLCQALDLRTLQAQFQNILINIIKEEITAHLSPLLPSEASASLHKLVIPAVLESLDNTTTKDAVPRLQVVAAAASAPLIDAFVSHSSFTSSGDAISAISTFRATVAARSAAALIALRQEFLTPEADGRGRTPASVYVAPKTKPVYEFIRRDLGIRMHGWENYNNFDENAGLAFGERTIGGDISLIYEAIRDGQLQNVIVGLFEA